MKLNDKGFAVSTILYALLISFLLFLLVTLKQVSASTNLMNAANDDLVNGGSLFARQVILTSSDGSNCTNWFNQEGKDTLVKVYSRYGIKFWPRDFSSSITNGKIKIQLSSSLQPKDSLGSEISGWYETPIKLSDLISISANYQTNPENVYWLKITDTVTTEVYYLPLYDICG